MREDLAEEGHDPSRWPIRRESSRAAPTMSRQQFAADGSGSAARRLYRATTQLVCRGGGCHVQARQGRAPACPWTCMAAFC